MMVVVVRSTGLSPSWSAVTALGSVFVGENRCAAAVAPEGDRPLQRACTAAADDFLKNEFGYVDHRQRQCPGERIPVQVEELAGPG